MPWLRSAGGKPGAFVQGLLMAQDSVQSVAPPAGDGGAGEREQGHGNIWKLTIGSVGVVYGDIGTSPLYALRESLAHTRATGLVDRMSSASSRCCCGRCS